jgi:hypothetical protein
LATGVQENISPQARRSDGGPASELKYRFNWNTPIIPSPHDPDTVYVGGNVVFKSTDFGTTWSVISPDLTTNDPEKQKDAGGPVWVENTTAEYHCTIISLAESPVQKGRLWVGTDDGRLWTSPDDGKTWIELTRNVPNLPPNSPVSHVEPSRADANTAYVAFDRHMLNDFKPYLYKTTDGGTTWQPLTNGLPDEAYVFVVREDPRNLNLLYAGTERGPVRLVRRRQNWQRMPNLPPVPVHDIMVHDLMNDLVIGTHGRSVYVLDDITPLQEVSPAVLEKPAHLFSPPVAWRHSSRMTRYGRGDRPMVAPNPPYGAMITFHLKEKPKEGRVRIQILDSQGNLLRELARVPQEPGVHRVVWDLRTRGEAVETDDESQTPPPNTGPLGPQVLPGTYRVKLIAGEFEMEQPLTVQCGACAGAAPDRHQGGAPVRAGDAGHDSPVESRDAGADQRRDAADEPAPSRPPAELQTARRAGRSDWRPPQANRRAESEGGQPEHGAGVCPQRAPARQAEQRLRADEQQHRSDSRAGRLLQ